ncbi:hypothetical protein MAM1_0010d01134 [Mucor ambiguus]|uniref:Uncharacterized protein n=1 Tax=Mucor ambiguus TaxID=91626 RepID=A0A0C9LQT8_9FUNG|nr:hypothetical protein MAM1_0010d01134 [Mucor ambiguus]
MLQQVARDVFKGSNAIGVLLTDTKTALELTTKWHAWKTARAIELLFDTNCKCLLAQATSPTETQRYSRKT